MEDEGGKLTGNGGVDTGARRGERMVDERKKSKRRWRKERRKGRRKRK